MTAAPARLAHPGLTVKAEQRLRELTRTHTGIVLGPDKSALLASRIQKRLRALGLPDFGAYVEHLDAHPEEVPHFVSAITTHTTSFFREASHFPLLVDALKARAEAGQRRVRVWCAAASTGQEPWTLALVLEPLARRYSLDLRILATDIDVHSLRVAARATYPDTVLDQIPDEHRTGIEPAEPGWFRIRPPARRLVRFASLNLTKPPFPLRGPLDAVMCRNVMIYLDVPARQALVREVERTLRPGALLLVGHSESLTGLSTGLSVVRPSVYRAPETP